MARRSRQGGSAGGERLRAPAHAYRDTDGNVLELRGAMTAATRTAYARIRSGEDLRPGASREDAWQRAVEFLFERLAVSWTIAGTPALTRQRDLLARLRVASPAERAWLRDRLREHCAEHFPDITAP
jgi:hypothetical protein